MSDIASYILTFFIGVAASFMGSTIGSGGLLSIGFLIFIGIPPQIAIATNRFGGLGQNITALYKFWRAGKIVWRYVLPLSILSIIGGVIGANLLIQINTDALQSLVGIILLALLPLLLVNDVGEKRVKTTRPKKIVGLVLFFLIMIFGGFFGGGTGTLIFYTLMITFGLTIIEANATDLIPWTLLSVTTLVIFGINGLINYSLGLILMVGMISGGYLGAHVALKKGDRWVKKIFIALVIAIAIKLLFF